MNNRLGATENATSLLFFSNHPLRIHTVERRFFVNMYYSQPILLDRSNIEKANFCQFFNVVSDGSPSRMRRVRRISFGMTTRPRSSILLTIPVAFISQTPYLGLQNLARLVFAVIMRKYRKIKRNNLLIDHIQRILTRASDHRRLNFRAVNSVCAVGIPQ